MRSRDERGFTLVELIIAISILAVVVIPISLAFMTSTRLTMVTRRQQRANTAATNVMEDIRADDPNQLIADKNLTADENGVYSYSTTEEVDGETYTVAVQLDPNYDSTDLNDETTDYNAAKLASFYSIDGTSDASFAIRTADDDEAALELADKIRPSEKNYDGTNSYADNVRKRMYRDIDLIITDNGSATRVDASVTYHIETGTAVYSTDPISQCVFSSSHDDSGNSRLENIYLFFSGLTSSRKSSPQETVTIYNETASADQPVPVDVYLIEQSQSSRYGMNVRVRDTGRSASDMLTSEGDLSVLTTVHTNLDEDAVTCRYATLSGAAFVKSHTVSGHIYPASEMIGFRGNETGRMFDSDTTGIYKVTVKAYRGSNEGGEPLVTLTSTAQTKK